MTAAPLIDLNHERAKRGLTNDPFISKHELAAHYKVSTRTIGRWLNHPAYKRGGQQVPHRRLWGGPVKFQISAVDAWLAESPDR